MLAGKRQALGSAVDSIEMFGQPVAACTALPSMPLPVSSHPSVLPTSPSYFQLPPAFPLSTHPPPLQPCLTRPPACTPTRRHDGPWWLTRAAVIAYLLVGVVVPTLVPRSLRVVAKFSSFSVCMLFLLASAISGLALVALAQGSIAQGVRWLPSYEVIGGSPLGALTSVLTVVSGAQCGSVGLGSGCGPVSVGWGSDRAAALLPLRDSPACGCHCFLLVPAGQRSWRCARALGGASATSVNASLSHTALPAVSALAFTCQFNLL